MRHSYQTPQMRILLREIRFKGSYRPYTHISRIFLAEAFDEKELKEIKALLCESCADSHFDFLKKWPNPLWKNPDFFVRLPFKKNEDINPTRATHTGMKPEELELAHKEWQQLLSEGLIEETVSQLACQAFYVNKRSEQQRGKKRLVINYQPLNHFLQDDKFPLPR